MEVFVDFGLFEFLAALGIASLARKIYSFRWSGIAFAVASIVIPGSLLYFVKGETTRLLAAGSLGTALVNAVVVLGALQRRDVPILTVQRRRRA